MPINLFCAGLKAKEGKRKNNTLRRYTVHTTDLCFQLLTALYPQLGRRCFFFPTCCDRWVATKLNASPLGFPSAGCQSQGSGLRRGQAAVVAQLSQQSFPAERQKFVNGKQSSGLPQAKADT